ncbi:unnamed protein product [Protopolystoma xenopodis]|uniref:Uncharacterized protein n=1 Tax=Protopolystoma xenopodis TaxID=117903 RepID=A0A448WDS7_9PLAT|nr:unnamed protein product [Protopolystoma xenopodis]
MISQLFSNRGSDKRKAQIHRILRATQINYFINKNYSMQVICTQINYHKARDLLSLSESLSPTLSNKMADTESLLLFQPVSQRESTSRLPWRYNLGVIPSKVLSISIGASNGQEPDGVMTTPSRAVAVRGSVLTEGQGFSSGIANVACHVAG